MKQSLTHPDTRAHTHPSTENHTDTDRQTPKPGHIVRDIKPHIMGQVCPVLCSLASDGGYENSDLGVRKGVDSERGVIAVVVTARVSHKTRNPRKNQVARR